MKINTNSARQIMERGALNVPEAIYAGCGKAWVAINPAGKIVAARYMGNFPLPNDADIDAVIHQRQPRVHSENFHRYRKYYSEYVEHLAFSAYRLQSRMELAALGTVMSGTMSGTKFYPTDTVARARVVNLAVCGDPEGIQVHPSKILPGHDPRHALALGKTLRLLSVALGAHQGSGYPGTRSA